MQASLLRAALRQSTRGSPVRRSLQTNKFNALRSMTTATKPLRAGEAPDYATTTITEDRPAMSGPQGPNGDPKMRYFTGIVRICDYIRILC